MPYPGRMAHITAFSFCSAGLSILLLTFSEKRARLSQVLAVITGLGALFAIIGYLYGVPVLYGSIEYTSMALHTGIGFLVGMFIDLVLPGRSWPDVGAYQPLSRRLAGA